MKQQFFNGLKNAMTSEELPIWKNILMAVGEEEFLCLWNLRDCVADKLRKIREVSCSDFPSIYFGSSDSQELRHIKFLFYFFTCFGEKLFPIKFPEDFLHGLQKVILHIDSTFIQIWFFARWIEYRNVKL